MSDLTTVRPVPARGDHTHAAVAIVLVAVLILALLVLQRWRSGLDLLTASSPAVTGPVRVGQTYYVDAGVVPVGDGATGGPGSVTVTVDRVSAGATLLTTAPGSGTFTGIAVGAVVCVRRPGTGAVGVASAAELAASCSAVRPLAVPETLALGFDTDQLLYQVPVTTVGTYQGFGIEVDYHQGIRAGAVRGTADARLVATSEGTRRP